MKLFRIFAAFLWCHAALAQNQPGPIGTPHGNPLPGDIWTFFGPTLGAGWGPISQLVPTVTFEAFGAIGDGFADDTVPIKNACATVAALGGGRIVGGTGHVYRVYAGTPPVFGAGSTSALCTFSNTANLYIDMNGSRINVAYTFTAGQTLALFKATGNSKNIYVNGLDFYQTTTVMPTASPIGTAGLVITDQVSNVVMQNARCSAGQANFQAFGDTANGPGLSSTYATSRAHGITLNSLYSNGCVYNVVLASNGDDVVAEPLTCLNLDRCLFAYGVTNVKARMTSTNPQANDVLLKPGGLGNQASGSTHSGSTTVDNITNTSFMVVGQAIADGLGDIPAGARIATLSLNSLTLTVAATGSHAANTLVYGIYGTETTGSNVVTAIGTPLPTNLAVGQTFQGAGWPNGTVITAIGTNTITVSQNSIGTGSFLYQYGMLPVRNIDLAYQYNGRTDAASFTGVTIDLQGPTGLDANNVPIMTRGSVKNIHANIDADLSGDAVFAPIIRVQKTGSAVLNGAIEDVVYSGTIRNARTGVLLIIDLFSNTVGSNWSGEYVCNVGFKNLTVESPNTATAQIDMAGFTVAGNQQPGCNLFFENSIITPTITFNNADVRRAYYANSTVNGFYYGTCSVIGGSALDPGIQAAQPINTAKFYGRAGYSASSTIPSTGLLVPGSKIRDLFVQTDINPLGTDTADIFGGAGLQGFACSIPSGQTTCTDQTTISQQFNPGTAVWMKYTTANTGTARSAAWTAKACSP